MKWSEGHDIFFLKEVRQFKPWQHKKGTTERGEVWGNLALLLGSNTDPLFHVTQRSVRDRYMLLEKRYRKKVADDKKASGTSPNQSEVDILLEEIVALFDEANQLHESNKRKIQEEASQAEEMRNASLETFKQTKDRQDETPKAKKKRASGADSMAFIKERAEVESQQRAGDMELRRQQLQMEKRRERLI